MIRADVQISQSLMRKLSPSWMDDRVSELVDGVATATLWNIQEYGIGVAKTRLAYPNYDPLHEYESDNRTPSGGAPVWQGEIRNEGHYRGYLSESHYINKVSLTESEIGTPAEFVWGVIEGYSVDTGDEYEPQVRFPPNPYHKRAVDKMKDSGVIQTIWKNAMDR